MASRVRRSARGGRGRKTILRLKIFAHTEEAGAFAQIGRRGAAIAVSATRRWSLRIDAQRLGALTLHADPKRVRPADILSVGHDTGNARGVPVASLEPADSTLGVPACAVCRHPEATPTLAGDRALGPDHIYLVCDQCGRRWQRYS